MPLWQEIVDRDKAAARAALGDEAFTVARSRGQAMPRDRGVAFALEGSG